MARVARRTKTLMKSEDKTFGQHPKESGMESDPRMDGNGDSWREREDMGILKE